MAVTGSDVVRCRKLVARDASVLALHRILASRRRDWRLAPPTGIMMRALCEVRQSGATPRWDLLPNPGLGVFATTNIPVGTLLFWACTRLDFSCVSASLSGRLVVCVIERRAESFGLRVAR